MPAPKPLVALVALVDAVLVTLKSLTTVRAVLPSVRPSVRPPSLPLPHRSPRSPRQFLLLIAFGVGARVINGLARYV